MTKSQAVKNPPSSWLKTMDSMISVQLRAQNNCEHGNAIFYLL